MTIGNEIVSLAGTTEDIKTEIKNQGQSVSATTKLSELPDKINSIINTGGEKIVYTLNEVVEGTITDLFDKTCTYLRPNCFRGCTKLEKATFCTITKICEFAFCSCYNLRKLILPNGFVKLDDINAFRYTPIGRLDGFIYVNPDLWDVYRTDETWKYFYSIIKPYNVEEITTTINFVVNELPTEDDYQFI